MTHEFLTFTRRLEFMEATTISQDEYCDLWIGVWKLSQGRKDFCETEFLSQALVINEDNIIPYVWMLHYANHVSDQLQEDILASLTSLPYWFDNGGRFQIRMGNQIRYLDHSQETNQLFGLVSNLVEPGSKSDLTALHWLLTGRGLEPKLKDFSTSLLLNLAIGLGFEIPKLFLGSLSTIQTIPYDISVKSCSDLKFTSTDDCVFRFGEIGMLGSIDCFKSVGDVFKLWNRHHQWSNMDPFRKLVISSDSTLVEQMQDVHCRFSKYLGGSALQLRRNPRFLAFWSQVRDPGSYGRSLDYTSWTLKVTGGESMNIEQNINLHSSKLKVLPKVANFKDTFFILNNPKLTTSSILDTGSTQAHLNLFFQRAFADDNHWFIGQIQDQFLAIYSHQPVNWTSVVSPRRIVKSLTAPGSQNVWIVHAESGVVKPAIRSLRFI
ncbi:uncharacterized protein LOC131891283 [Tigriopus californicus]|uniref:uncharacterized protein LOC131891283 n=1 Tax=Tigriopus californicus TaxID=6832 RepID=UPI0027D9E0CD|nr:uncharacterized protein LOC131891283 [Tigriopus californicus]